MFQRIIRCPISFFDLNPVGQLSSQSDCIDTVFLCILGRILNRFTKDVAIVDEQLPFILYEFSHVSLFYPIHCKVTKLILLVSVFSSYWV